MIVIQGHLMSQERDLATVEDNGLLPFPFDQSIANQHVQGVVEVKSGLEG